MQTIENMMARDHSAFLAKLALASDDYEFKSDDDESTLGDVKEILESQGDDFMAFKKRIEERQDKLETALKRGAKGAGEMSAAFESTDCAAEKKAVSDFMRQSAEQDFAKFLPSHPGRKSMSVGSDPDGGYVVLPTLSSEMTKIELDTSPIRQIARIVTISSDAFEEVVDKGTAAAEWVSETGTRGSTTTPQLAKLRIPVHEEHAQPAATQKLLDDGSIDIESWLAEKAAQAFTVQENTAFVTGNGIGQPVGFTTYPTGTHADTTRGWGTLQYIPTGTLASLGTGTVPYEKLVDLVQSVKAGYRPGAVFLMNKSTVGTVRKIKDDSGQFIWQREMQAGQPSTLLGYPVLECEDMASVGTNTFPIAFGNFRRGYTIVDRQGIRILRDPYTNKPYVLFDTTKRVGADVTNFEAIKLLKAGS